MVVVSLCICRGSLFKPLSKKSLPATVTAACMVRHEPLLIGIKLCFLIVRPGRTNVDDVINFPRTQKWIVEHLTVGVRILCLK